MRRYVLLPTLIVATFACKSRSFQDASEIEAAGGATVAGATLPTAGSLQAVVVTTSDWNNIKAQMQMFERDKETSPWKAVGNKTAAVLGAKGIAWGRGLHKTPNTTDPQKKEGDGRAPAGVFPIKNQFGFADELAPGGNAKFPYMKLLQSTECVDDPNSKYYNQIVDKNKVANVDWNSSEKMRFEPLYKWGAWIGHNTKDVVKSGGSCIFFHIWKAADKGTAGCTAMTEADLLKMLKWLDQKSKPILIQMPESTYTGLKNTWNLP